MPWWWPRARQTETLSATPSLSLHCQGLISFESPPMSRSTVTFVGSQRRHAPLVFVLVMFLVASAPAGAVGWPAWFTFASDAPIGLTAATTALQALPVSASPAIAVHATPEGHWQFTNRAGETFTAGTSAEIKRASAALLPDAMDGFAGATLILSQETLFTGTAVLKDLPQAKAYFAPIDGGVLAVGRGPSNTLTINLRPGLVLAAETQDLAREALAQLRRPLDATRLRILSATPGGPATLTATPKFDTAQGSAAIDAIEPDHLVDALASIPRQTAIVTARLDGTTLAVLPASSAERTISYAALTLAAASADVDLLVLHADPPRQPGGRNWLWQRVQVSGLEHATKRATFADFLDQLATGHDPFVITLSAEGSNRIRFTAQPVSAALTTARGVTGWLRQATGTVTSQVTGAVEPGAIHASLVSMSRRNELSYRLFPGLPATPLAVYFGAIGLGGLAGLPVALRWWRKIWPSEARADYSNASGFLLARLIRMLAFAAVFLPIVAIPAVLARFGRRAKLSTAREGG